MSSRTVYLAGPITGLTFDGCTNWRTHAAAELSPHGIECFSPMRALDYLRGLGIGTLGGSDEKHPLTTRKAITARDRFDVQRCDVVLMNLLDADRISIGTMIEVGWADALRKPIVLAIEPRRLFGRNKFSRNKHAHPMLEEIASFVARSLPEAIDLTRAILA